jgi:nicotinamide mononucleotide adenylyltransferase
MTTVVIMPGGFHPFHAGHAALYQSAKRAFPGAEVFVAATNDTSTRPFPFAVKEKLAQLAGVDPGHFVQVKSPFRAEEITQHFNPDTDNLIFIRSEKDEDKPPVPGGVKKDGTASYLQPLMGATGLEPFARHAYMAYLPVVEFGPGMTSATEIRTAWPQLNEKRKLALVMSLYPATQSNPALAKNVVRMLDTAMGTEITEVLDTKASNATSLWNYSDPDMVKFNFTASNGVQYQLDFLAPYIGPDEMGPEDFFDSDEVFDNSKFVSFEQITQDMKGGHPVVKQGIEGTGSAAEVFGIVVNAIIQYVKKARPSLLYFQAAEPNRRALYARMIQRVLPSLPGWASMSLDGGQFGIYNKRAVKTAMGENQGWAATYEATSAQNFVGGMTASYQARENQPVSEDYVLEKTSA